MAELCRGNLRKHDKPALVIMAEVMRNLRMPIVALPNLWCTILAVHVVEIGALVVDATGASTTTASRGQPDPAQGPQRAFQAREGQCLHGNQCLRLRSRQDCRAIAAN